jgi:2-keto-4-pentenoate hydratase/2-oxohepta-3-ene-1,7-dioic acid hydratase in catechol pathway
MSRSQLQPELVPSHPAGNVPRLSAGGPVAARSFFGACLVVLLLIAGCGTPVVKVAAFDRDVLSQIPLPAERLRAVSHGEHVVAPGSAWLSDVVRDDRLTFAALRQPDGTHEYAAVVACDPSSDQLALLPLANGRTPLEVLEHPAARADLHGRVTRLRSQRDAAKEAGVKILSLEDTIDAGRLTAPIPAPRRIYAVAANFPSHLRHDLAIALSPAQRAALRTARARVFLKHPRTTATGEINPDAEAMPGPFDTLTYPAEIQLPRPEDSPAAGRTETRFDYEVEVGAVIGRRLTAAEIAHLSDAELLGAIAGYVLVSDSKARNPQVVDKLVDADASFAGSPYAVGDDQLDRALGSWDTTTCRWWSFAASRVDATALGPLLVAAPRGHEFPTRPVLAARSYAVPDVRGAPLPAGRDSDVLYLRQCALVSDDSAYDDALIWGIPAIIRSILAEQDNALHFSDFEVELAPGDVICLGTPGGTVITSRPESVLAMLRHLLFWWRPRNFHDAFFRPDAELYLRHGDAVFFWGADLGYQHHVIRRIE